MGKDEFLKRIPHWLRWSVHAMLEHATVIIIVAMGVVVMAFYNAIAKHIEQGSFFESLLWIAGAFAIVFVAGTLLLLWIRSFLPQEKTGQSSESQSLTISDNRNGPIFKFGVSMDVMLVCSIVLLMYVVYVRGRQYIYAHRMQAVAAGCIAFRPVNETGQSYEFPFSYIGIDTYITNGGPDSKPFNWKLTAATPNGSHPFDGESLPVSKWNQPGFDFTISVHQSNDIATAFLADTMKSGTQKEGILIFKLNGVPSSEIRFGTKFMLSFEDGQGHQVKAETAWNGPISTQTFLSVPDPAPKK
jgi:hypothetical protein